MRQVMIAVILCAVLFAGSSTAWGATFGQLTTGGLNVVTVEGRAQASRYTLTEDGYAAKMTANLSVSVAAKDARGMIFRASDSMLVGWTQVTNVTASSGDYDFNFSPSLPLRAGDYFLAIWGFSGGGIMTLTDDGAEDGLSLSRTIAYSNQTFSPYVPSSSDVFNWPIQCTYTPATLAVFGDTVVRADNADIESQLYGGTYIAPSASSRLDSVVAWLDVTDGSGTTAKLLKMAAYDSLSGDLLDTTASRLINIDASMDGHYVFHFTTDPTLTASQGVVLMIMCDTSTNGVYSIRHSTAGGLTGVLVSGHYSSLSGIFPDPHGGTKVATWRPHIFAYTTPVSAGGFKGRKRRIDGMKQSFIFREAQQEFAGSHDNFVR